MPDNLKPCPFCGGKPLIHHLGGDSKTGFYISCDECEVQQIAIHTVEGATIKWNKRK